MEIELYEVIGAALGTGITYFGYLKLKAFLKTILKIVLYAAAIGGAVVFVLLQYLKM